MDLDSPAFFLRSTARSFPKPLGRWRSACAAVYSCRAFAAWRWLSDDLVLRRPSYVSIDLSSTDVPARHRRYTTAPSEFKLPAASRWRVAYAVIRCCRALVPLAKGRLVEIIKRRPSFVVLDVGDDDKDCTVRRNAAAAQEVRLSLVDRRSLAEIVKGKSADGLRDHGGVRGIAASLESSLEAGIDGHDDGIGLRRKLFGSNTYKKPRERGFLSFVREAFGDPMLIILLVCAALSLGFGIKEHGVKEGWYDGVSILVAVFLVVAVSAVSNFRQARRFTKLSDECGNIRVRVVRGGRRQEISIFDVVVGDVVCLQIGDQVPADGVFLDGHSLQLDESSMTGESDHVAVDAQRNPFLTSGTKIADGYARMLVTSVGMDTTWGEMMSSISHDTSEPTPLQERLQKLTSGIGKIGTAVAVLVLAVLLVRHFTGSTKDENGKPKFDKKNVSFDRVRFASVPGWRELPQSPIGGRHVTLGSMYPTRPYVAGVGGRR